MRRGVTAPFCAVGATAGPGAQAPSTPTVAIEPHAASAALRVSVPLVLSMRRPPRSCRGAGARFWPRAALRYARRREIGKHEAENGAQSGWGRWRGVGSCGDRGLRATRRAGWAPGGGPGAGRHPALPDLVRGRPPAHHHGLDQGLQRGVAQGQGRGGGGPPGGDPHQVPDPAGRRDGPGRAPGRLPRPDQVVRQRGPPGPHLRTWPGTGSTSTATTPWWGSSTGAGRSTSSPSSPTPTPSSTTRPCWPRPGSRTPGRTARATGRWTTWPPWPAPSPAT